MNEEASMDQLFLDKVLRAIEKNLANESFGVDELAHEIGISRSQLHRRLKSINGQSASQMIREYRLKRAHEMLQQKVGTVSEISYQVGFSSPSYFNTCFHEYFGFPPGKVKRIRPSRFTKKYSISWKSLFISLATLVVVALMIILFLETRITDKSVAVLPFLYLGDDPGKQYHADAVMDGIIFNLSSIENLRVMPRISVAQYHNTDKTASQICKEQNVRYLIESSFQKHGDQVRIIVQLIRPGRRERQIWTEEYNRNWEDIFSVQSEVAQSIAKELDAVITPEEKQQIEKIPTPNLTAYIFYQRGRNEYLKFEIDNDNREALKRAEDLYYRALEYDPTYAQVYTGLGWVYKDKHFWKTYLAENFLDSILILADIALSIDHQLAEAYILRGEYYRFNNDREQAINEYEKAIKFNPNDWRAYWYKGALYFYDDYVKIIDNHLIAASLHRGPLLPAIYTSIGSAFSNSGFKETSIFYTEEVVKLDDDSASYYRALGGNEETYGNFEKAIEFYKKSSAFDSTHLGLNIRLGMTHCFIGQFEKYLEYFKKYEARYKTIDETNPAFIFFIGHAYWVNGLNKEAEYYFDAGLEYYNKLLERDRHFARDIYIFKTLAAMHAFLDDKDKAYEYLRRMNQSQRFPHFEIKDLKNNPLFDSIRDEQEFQQIVTDVEAKCQAEHERVKKWLEENEML